MESNDKAGSLAPSDDPSWARYASTILELRTPAGNVVIDLRRPLSDAHREFLGGVWGRAPFAVVTAFNPAGRHLSPSENEIRYAELRDVLVRDGIPHFPADGLSPDRRHREPGFVVCTSLDKAAGLALEFEQSAFFWFDGDLFWIVGALVAAPPKRLPLSAA